MNSICFVGQDNYPVINPSFGSKYIGGESVQQTLLARAFVDMNYDTSMIVKDLGQADVEYIDSIKILKTYKQEAGIPVLRFFYPRMTSIWKALKNADADIYYQSCAGMMTGLVALFCKLNNRKFLFRIAHDSDCIPGKQIIKYSRDRMLYEYGLRNADLISAQGDNQKMLLKQNYGLESTVVNMAVEMDMLPGYHNRDIDILWVNNMRPFKRPELAVEIARLLPEYSMTIIGGPVPEYNDIYNEINNSVSGISNLDFAGTVPYSRVNDYFRRAKIFINTSESEGFPNSFLQAWARGVPVISFFDPDNLITKHGLGNSPDSLGTMIDTINIFLSDESIRIEVGNRAREFVKSNYTPSNVVKHYIDLINQTC